MSTPTLRGLIPGWVPSPTHRFLSLSKRADLPRWAKGLLLTDATNCTMKSMVVDMLGPITAIRGQVASARRRRVLGWAILVAGSPIASLAQVASGRALFVAQLPMRTTQPRET